MNRGPITTREPTPQKVKLPADFDEIYPGGKGVPIHTFYLNYYW